MQSNINQVKRLLDQKKKKQAQWDLEKAVMKQDLQFARYQIQQLKNNIIQINKTHQSTVRALINSPQPKQQLEQLKQKYQQQIQYFKSQLILNNKRSQQFIQNLNKVINDLHLDNQKMQKELAYQIKERKRLEDQCRKGSELLLRGKFQLQQAKKNIVEHIKQIQELKNQQENDKTIDDLNKLRQIFNEQRMKLQQSHAEQQYIKQKKIWQIKQQYENKIRQLQHQNNIIKQQLQKSVNYYKQSLQNIQNQTVIKCQNLNNQLMNVKIDLNRQNAKLSQQSCFLKKQVQQLKKSKEQMQKKYQDKIQKLQQQIYNNINKLNQIQTQNNQLHFTISQNNQQFDMLSQKIYKISQQNMELHSNVQELSQKIREFQEREQRLSSQIHYQGRKSGFQRGKRLQLEMKIRKLQEDNQQVKIMYQKDTCLLQQKLQFITRQHNKTKEELKQSIQSFQNTIQRLNESKQKEREKYNTLKKKIQEYEEKMVYHQGKQFEEVQLRRLRKENEIFKTERILVQNSDYLREKINELQNKLKQSQHSKRILTFQFQKERAKWIVEKDQFIQFESLNIQCNQSLRKKQRLLDITNLSSIRYNN